MEKKILNLEKNKYFFILFICLISLFLYFPSLFNFFSHDDFFHLKISQASSFGDFINFFNLTNAPLGFGFYRPLTIQIFYFLGNTIYNLNPIPMHIISFLTLFLIILFVYKLAYLISENLNVSLIATFLYAVSATHFGQLYFLGAFQELGYGLFLFSCVLLFILYLKKHQIKYYFFAILLFLGALMSKESAVILPGILILIYLFYSKQNKINIKNQQFLLLLIPFLVILFGYLYLHFFYYGINEGDSYIWDFSLRVLNTLFWYLLWSFNLPEMLVDFIGPGFSILPNLFKFYSSDIIPIFAFFVINCGLLVSGLVNVFKKIAKSYLLKLLFCGLWFVTTLLPVLFLPWHKFTYELTVPLFGVTLFTGLLLSKMNKYLILTYLFIFLTLSFLTIQLTFKTHWTVQGGKVAKNVFEYLDNNYSTLDKKITIVFFDIPEDNKLPWKPSGQLKLILSDNNFYQVFYKNKIQAIYGEEKQLDNGQEIVKIKARQFFNYQ